MVAGKDRFDQVFDDTRLDWDELGLLLFLISRGDRFTMPMRELYQIRAAGRASVDRGVQRLEDLGYLQRARDRSGGRYGVTVWTISKPSA